MNRQVERCGESGYIILGSAIQRKTGLFDPSREPIDAKYVPEINDYIDTSTVDGDLKSGIVMEDQKSITFSSPQMERKLFLISAADIAPQAQIRLKDILRKGGEKKTVAYTSTVGNDGRNPFVPNQIWQWFKNHGYTLNPVALNPTYSAEAQDRIRAADIIVFNGGDPFQLLRLVRETGVDKILIEKIKEGYPYIGSSAAAMLVGPTIEPALYHPDGGTNTTRNHDLTSLGLIPDIIWPHYQNDHYLLIQALSRSFPYQFKMISDYQAIVYEGDKSEIIGPADPRKPPSYSTP